MLALAVLALLSVFQVITGSELVSAVRLLVLVYVAGKTTTAVLDRVGLSTPGPA